MTFDWNPIITYILEGIISIAVPALFWLIKSKIENEKALKLIDWAEQIVYKCTAMIEQTYVIPSKNEDEWDHDHQVAAFEDCKTQIQQILGHEAIAAINKICGDFDAWCEAQIEANVLLIH